MLTHSLTRMLTHSLTHSLACSLLSALSRCVSVPGKLEQLVYGKAPGVRSVMLMGDRFREGIMAVVVPDDDFIRAYPALAKAAETVRTRWYRLSSLYATKITDWDNGIIFGLIDALISPPICASRASCCAVVATRFRGHL